MCMHMCVGLTNKPDDVEGGVGEDWCIGFIKVIVRLFPASYGLSGHTDVFRRWR